MPVTDTTTSAEHAFLDELDKKLWNAAELEKISGTFKAWKHGRATQGRPGRHIGAEETRAMANHSTKNAKLVANPTAQFAESRNWKPKSKNWRGLDMAADKNAANDKTRITVAIVQHSVGQLLSVEIGGVLEVKLVSDPIPAITLHCPNLCRRDRPD